MIRVMVSACLLGECVRYHGGDARLRASILERWSAEGRLVPFCPEVAGGLGVPRAPAEIVGGDGAAVIDGDAQVVTAAGEDVTAAFVDGATKALGEARETGVGLAVLVDRSPSCGSRRIYDGTFSGVRRDGVGVTAALLERHGIRVFDEERLDEAQAFLDSIESAGGGAQTLD